MAPKKEVSFTVSAQDKASAELKKVQNVLGELSGKWFDFGSMLKGFGGILAGISFTVIIKDLLDLGTAVDRSMRAIAASLPTGVAGLQQLKDQIDQVAEASGRKIDEVRAAAQEIAKLGASSAMDVAERLRVATEFADATGADLKTSAAGVTEVMRVFNLSAGQVEQVMANLVSAAEGRVDVEELFAVFGRAAPVLQKLGVDADTAGRALIALVERGFTAKKAGAFIDQLDLEGIRQLAKEATTTGEALEKLHAKAELVREGTDRMEQAFKSRISATLEDLGTKILPVVTAGLTALDNVLNLIAGKNLDSIASNIKALGPMGMFLPSYPSAPGGAPFGGGGGFSGSSGSSGDFGGTTPPRGALPLTEADKQKIAEIRAEITKLTQTTVEGRTKAEEMAAAIAKLAIQMDHSRMSAQDKAAAMALLNAQLGSIKTEEAQKAFRALEDQMLELSGDAVGQATKKMKDALDELAKHRQEALDAGAVGDFDAQVAAITLEYKKQIGVLKEMEASKNRLREIDEWLFNHPPEAMSAEELSKWGDMVAKEVDDLTAKLKDPSLTQAQRDALTGELVKARAELEKWGRANVDEINRTVHGWEILQQAMQKWRDDLKKGIDGVAELGRGLIAAGQASGVMSTQTAADLQNVLTLAQSIGSAIDAWGKAASAAGGLIEGLMSGNFFGAIAGGIASIAALSHTIFGGPSPEEQAARDAAIAAANKASDALENLAKHAGDLAKVQASGAQISGGKVALQDFFHPGGGADYFNASGLTGAIGGQGLQNLSAELHKVGLSFAQLQGIAHDLGVSLSDMPTWEELRNLKTAMDNADMHAFVDSFAGGLERLSRSFDIFGITDPKAKFAQFITLLTDPNVGAPALFSALGKLDLSTASGIAAARKQIQDLFKRAAAGELTPEQMGGLNLQQFLDALSQLMGLVNEAGTAIGVAATAMDGLNRALSDIDKAAKIMGTSKPDVLKQMIDAYAKVFPELNGILDGLDLTKAEDLDKLKDRLRAVFQSLQDAGTLPDGTNIDDLINAILALMGAADDAASSIASAAQQISDAANSLQVGFDILGTGSADQAQQLAGLYGLPDLGDLSTKAGVDAAIATLQDLYKAHPDDKALAQHIQQVISLLRSIKFDTAGGATGGSPAAVGMGAVGNAGPAPSGSAVSSTFSALTTGQGDQLVDLQRQTRDACEMTADMAKIIADFFLSRSGQSGVIGASAPARIGSTLQLGPINIDVIAQGTDPHAFGDEIADEFIRRINMKLGTVTLSTDLFRGLVGRS